MFSSALKSFGSSISNTYTISKEPSSICGPWKVYDAKKRAGGKPVSVFVFDKKSLEPQAGLGRSGGGVGLRQAQDEVVERLRKEAASLARLRHPSILQLEEPVEDTQSGGLRFATEPVTDSLAGLLREKDGQEAAGGSKYVVEDAAGGRRRREVEIDELEIQKGLLQLAKGLEFLHESAALVHGNLTPEAIFINAKADWKISGLGFSSPPANATNPSVAPMALSEVLNHDSRLPRHVQLNLDYTSPDLVIDNNITTSTDMFSLGLVIISMYNKPHRSPIDTSMSLSTYKRILSSPASTPTQRNNYLSAEPIPDQVVSSLLPRLITRRPAQRYSAREFQEAQYFDNMLVSTLRFLDDLPAKNANEKSQFMRGFPRILSQFPKSVLEKKVLPALLEEMKDAELLSPILEVVFGIVETAPNGKRVFSERVIPRLREVFLVSTGKGTKSQERDASKEGGLVVILENMPLVAKSCSSKDFKDDILPIIFLGLDAQTHSIQDAALSHLSVMLPILDFSTIKNDLFPVVAHVFSKTSSMAIKIRGLEAFHVLCGGSVAVGMNSQDLMGTQMKSNSSSSAVLDKYTVQEKVVPLLKGIKTKEPTVMMAALEVFKQVAKVADAPFLAFDVLPVLWQLSLGPLLNLDQFQEFMSLIKTVSTRIEDEQTRKLQQLGGRGATSAAHQQRTTNGATADGDFESLVTGRSSKTNGAMDDSWESAWTDDSAARAPTSQQRQHRAQNSATFSWSTPATEPIIARNLGTPHSQISRTVTPDSLASFAALAPSKPVQQSGAPSRPVHTQQQVLASPTRPGSSKGSAGNYAAWPASSDASNPWALPQPPPAPSQQTASNPWAAIPASNNWSAQNNALANARNGIRIEPPTQKRSPGGFGQPAQPQQPPGTLDKWESLL